MTSGRLAAQSIAKELGLYGEESGSVSDGQAALNGTESGQEGRNAPQSSDPDADVHEPAAPDQEPDGGLEPSKPVPEAVPVPIYKPGIYTASADGMNGPVVLTVEFSDSEILSITCEDDETPELGGMAIAELTEQVLQYQGINFDSVSGATITSDAFRTALMKCQQQAFLQ